MAKVLLTGSAGGVGRATRPALEAAGWAIEPFDLADGDDLRDEAAVRRATAGCQAVVHAGALAPSTPPPRGRFSAGRRAAAGRGAEAMRKAARK